MDQDGHGSRSRGHASGKVARSKNNRPGLLAPVLTITGGEVTGEGMVVKSGRSGHESMGQD